MSEYFEITIRDNWGDKVVRREIIDSLDMSVREVMRQHQRRTFVQQKVDEFIKKHGRANLKYFWTPEMIPVPPPPTAPPEPIGFDVLVDECGV